MGSLGSTLFKRTFGVKLVVKQLKIGLWELRQMNQLVAKPIAVGLNTIDHMLIVCWKSGWNRYRHSFSSALGEWSFGITMLCFCLEAPPDGSRYLTEPFVEEGL